MTWSLVRHHLDTTARMAVLLQPGVSVQQDTTAQKVGTMHRPIVGAQLGFHAPRGYKKKHVLNVLLGMNVLDHLIQQLFAIALEDIIVQGSKKPEQAVYGVQRGIFVLVELWRYSQWPVRAPLESIAVPVPEKRIVLMCPKGRIFRRME